jgi:hypothetical protein
MRLLPMWAVPKVMWLKRQKRVFGENLPVGFVPGIRLQAEHTGVHAGKVDLFVNHKVILTPFQPVLIGRLKN